MRGRARENNLLATALYISILIRKKITYHNFDRVISPIFNASLSANKFNPRKFIMLINIYRQKC